MQKKYIEVVFKTVKGFKTDKMAEARIRDGFLKPLGESLDQYNTDKTAIFTKFCAKKEGSEELNKTDTPDGKVNYVFEKESIPQLTEELLTLNNEEVDIKFPAQIKDFIENSKYETEAGETLLIDEVLAKI